jgi:hypothetical protein
VCAMPMQSRPASTAGMHACCTGVGRLRPSALQLPTCKGKRTSE